MPFRYFAFMIIAVIAFSALSIWVVAEVAVHASITPVPAFAILGLVALIASVILRRRDG
ncbi:hypothetical protein [Yoonia sp. 2307UL14-13]|uniref:hypothetical protein n=1 Tax=Yoonia sp. 2307UL14-13 TaxID=3126506 RepID=UPI00309A5595